MSKPCGCCEGIGVKTPESTANRPGLAQLHYRAGRHGTFLETMKARAAGTLPWLGALKQLTTREAGDPSIALMDAWATVADILTFYQERIANEGYLRTATERRSLVELARLVGYTPRPGVAASVHLAFTLQKDFRVKIPRGTPVKSVPGENELPQTFETSADLVARADWNQLLPRPSRPQDIQLAGARNILELWLDGAATKLKPNDRLLLAFGNLTGQQVMRRVDSIEEDHENQRTKVTLQLELFTSLAYVRRFRSVLESLQAQVGGLSPLLDGVLANLSLAMQPDLTLVDLDTALAAGIAQLDGGGSGLTTSRNNLHALSLTAAAMATGLSQKLAQPDAALAQAVSAIATTYGTGESLAIALDKALRAYRKAAASGAAVSQILTALNTAVTAVKAAAQPISPFQALPTEAAALDTAWATVPNTVAGALQNAITQAGAPLATAQSLGEASADATDKAVAAKVKTVRDNLAAAAANKQASAIEQAVSDLTGLNATDPQINQNVTTGRQRLEQGLAAARTALVGANSTLDQHTGLFAGDNATAQRRQQLRADARQVLQTLTGGFATLNLRQQAAALVTAGDGMDHRRQDAVNGGETLLGQVFAELGDALSAVPAARDTQKALIAILDANPVPVNLPDGSPEKTRAGELAQSVSALKTQLGADLVPAAVDDTRTAVVQFNAASKSIEDESKSLEAAGQLLQDGKRQLQEKVLEDYRQSLKTRLVSLAVRYCRRIPEGPGMAEARAACSDIIHRFLALQSSTSLKDSAEMLHHVVDGLAAPASASGVVREWFQSLAGELRTIVADLEEARMTQPGVEKTAATAFERLSEITSALEARRARAAAVSLDLMDLFGVKGTQGPLSAVSDALANSLIAFNPNLRLSLFTGLRSQIVETRPVEVYALRVKASLFGHNAAKPVKAVTSGQETKIQPDGSDQTINESSSVIFLDSAYDQILPNSWMFLERPSTGVGDAGFEVVALAGSPSTSAARAEYGLSGKTTRIELLNSGNVSQKLDWYSAGDGFTVVRTTSVFAGAEKMALAEQPLGCPVGAFDSSDKAFAGCTSTPDRLELDKAYDGLEPGRALIVTGERLDVPGVTISELVTLARVEQNLDPTLPGDTLHTTLVLLTPLVYGYKRGTVKILGNVAKATHGETQKEILGSGEAGQQFQSFSLSHLPLTFVSAPSVSGIENTLQVRVNDVLWHETDTLADKSATDRVYLVKIEDSGKTTVTFGNGRQGARLPTGAQNIRAMYRSGIGKAGNVAAGQLTILGSPPLGVTAVNNPLAASGGAGRESADALRKNAPLAVMALDRLVSTADYADFTRTYAGIAKTSAVRLSDGHSSFVYVTIAGLEDVPIDPTSDLFVNLHRSLVRYGDPHLRVDLAPRELLLLVLQAGIAVDPDYEWVKVEAAVRQALLDAFSFDRQELGQDVILSRLLSVVQAVPGVLYVDLDVLSTISKGEDLQKIPDKIRSLFADKKPPANVGVEDARMEAGVPKPAQIAYFSPEVKETLVLYQISEEQSQ